uniref:Uncharacterized protein n=1 Tax=Glossina austeni TaxID=7395 RepID=A0A1A9UQC9_GLOAU
MQMKHQETSTSWKSPFIEHLVTSNAMALDNNNGSESFDSLNTSKVRSFEDLLETRILKLKQQEPQQQRNGGNLNNEIVEVGGEYITIQKTTINRILQKKPYNNNFPLFVHFKPFESWRMLHTLNGGHCATLCHRTLQAD